MQDKQDKELVYQLLRSSDKQEILRLLKLDTVRKYLNNLSIDNPDHQHAAKLLDEKIDFGEQNLVCEIIETVWGKNPKSLPKIIRSNSAIMDVINTQQQLLIYRYNQSAQCLRAKKIPDDITALIFTAAIEDRDPLNSVALRKITHETALKIN